MFFPIYFAVRLLSAAAIPHVLLARWRPTATLVWISAVIPFPGAGALSHFAFGADRIRRKRTPWARSGKSRWKLTHVKATRS